MFNRRTKLILKNKTVKGVGQSLGDEQLAIVDSFKFSFEKETPKDLLLTFGDGTIDILTNNDAIDCFPVLKILHGIYKIGKNFNTARLMKKTWAFLWNTQDFTQEQKRKFLKDFSDANQERGAEVLLDIINRIENVNKIAVLCNLIKSRIAECITIEELVRLVFILERVPISELTKLYAYKENHYVPGESELLYASGLVYEAVLDRDNGSQYALSANGRQLLKFGLGIDVEQNVIAKKEIPGTVWEDDIAVDEDIEQLFVKK